MQDQNRCLCFQLWYCGSAALVSPCDESVYRAARFRPHTFYKWTGWGLQYRFIYSAIDHTACLSNQFIRDTFISGLSTLEWVLGGASRSSLYGRLRDSILGTQLSCSICFACWERVLPYKHRRCLLQKWACLILCGCFCNSQCHASFCAVTPLYPILHGLPKLTGREVHIGLSVTFWNIDLSWLTPLITHSPLF